MPHTRANTIQRANTEETRHAILRAARDLFMEHGYRVVTTRMVAEASGVKQPLLYYHFADKETLYLEVHREQATASRLALERIVARHNDMVSERLRAVAQYLRRSRHHNMGMFFYELEHEMSPAMRARLKELFQLSILIPIMSIFEEGISTGYLRSPEQGGVPARLATYLLLSTISNIPTSVEVEDAFATEKNGPSEKKYDPVEMVVHVLLYGMVTNPVSDAYQYPKK
jgi:AcrR family transcriptional regulator